MIRAKLVRFIFRHTLLRYAIVGGIAALIDISFFAFFAKWLGYSYLWVAAEGFILATLINYQLSRRFVFAATTRFTRTTELGLVYLVSLIGLSVHQLVLFWMVDHAAIGLMTSKLTATGIVFFWNYLARKYFVFAERRVA